MRGNLRLTFWILLLVFTGIILIFPLDLRFEYHSVQSPYILVNLPFFIVIFCVWLALLLFLTVTIECSEKIHWEGLALSIIFTSVFLGFWNILSSYRQPDGVWNLSTAEYIFSSGTISPHANIGYLEFPGIHILAATLTHITGLSLPVNVTCITVFFSMLLSISLYVLFFKILGDVRLGVFAVLLAIQGNWTQSLFAFFWPRYFGLILLVLFLVIIYTNMYPFRRILQDKILIIFLLLSATISYFVTTLSFIFILLGIFLIYTIRGIQRKAGKIVISYDVIKTDWYVIVLCLCVPMVWVIYYAKDFLATFTVWIQNFFNDIPARLSSKIFVLANANLGETIPLWANITRWLWLFFIYIFGSCLIFLTLLRFRKMDTTRAMIIGGFFGVIIVGIIGFLFSPGGIEGQRLLMYTPFFLVPIIMWYFSKIKMPYRSHVSTIAIVILFVISIPTFFAHNNRIDTDTYYSYDFSPGEFVKAIGGTGKELAIFSYGDTRQPITYYVSDATYITTSRTLDIKDETVLWNEAETLIVRFEQLKRERKIFISSERGKGFYEHLLGVEPDNRNWEELERRLQNTYVRIYSNGFVIIYGLF